MVIALLASVSLITACGASSAGLAPGLSGQVQPAQTGNPAGTSPPQLGTEILGAYFPATARQFAAGAEFWGKMWSLRTQITSACMTKYGFSFPTISVTAATAGIRDLSQFPDIAWMKQSGLMVPILNTAYPRTPAAPPGRKQAYDTNLSQCTKLASKPFSQLQHDTQALSNEWTTIFVGIQASPQVQGTLAQFSLCVRRAGVPADFSHNLNHFAVWAAGQITVPSTGVVLRGPDEYWGDVFVRCAQNLDALYEKLQLVAQAKFFQHHYWQVHQLATEVAQIVVSTERSIKADGAS